MCSVTAVHDTRKGIDGLLVKRDLAKMVHPDTGGDTDAAASINAAADVLTKALKK